VYNKYIGSHDSVEDFSEKYLRARRIVKERAGQRYDSSRMHYFQCLVENMQLSNSSELVIQLYNAYYSYVSGHIHLYTGVIDLFAYLKNRSIKIGIISNGISSAQGDAIIHALKIDKYVDFLVSSEEVGAKKPNSKPFELALKKSALNRLEVIMVGDKPSSDILGAQKVGIKTIYIGGSRKADIIPDYFASRIGDVLSIIKEII